MATFQRGIAIGLRADRRWNIAFVAFIKRTHGMGKSLTKPFENEFHTASRCVVGEQAVVQRSREDLID